MSTRTPSYRKTPPKLLGGVLCLDFINTVSWRGDPDDTGDRLTSYAELIYWASQVGILDAIAERRLLHRAERQPDAARKIMHQAIALREALARLVLAGKHGNAADLAVVNTMLAAAPARSKLLIHGRGYAWAGDPHQPALDSPLHAVVWSAADLLTSDQRRLVRSCGDRRCGWFFLDASPKGNRRWCSMKECGNRAKARRHYRESRS